MINFYYSNANQKFLGPNYLIFGDTVFRNLVGN